MRNNNYFKEIISICKDWYRLEREKTVYDLYDLLERETVSVFQNDRGILNCYYDYVLDFVQKMIQINKKIIFQELHQMNWNNIPFEVWSNFFVEVKNLIIDTANNEFDFLKDEIIKFCDNYDFNKKLKEFKIDDVKKERDRQIKFLGGEIDIELKKIRIKYNLSELTKKQLNDKNKYGYRCMDKVHLPGIIPKKRSNEIIINDEKVIIGDALFLLLLRLIVEIKNDKKGWISREKLFEERIIRNPDPENYQLYNNLRSKIIGSLLEKNPKEFIENNKSGEYRISTHPYFITYNKNELFKHPDISQKKSEDIDKIDLAEISDIAKMLPEK